MPISMTWNSRGFVKSEFNSWIGNNDRVRALSNEVALKLDALYKARKAQGLPLVHIDQYEKDATVQIKKALVPLLRTTPLDAKQRGRIAQYGVEAVAEALAPLVWNDASLLANIGEPRGVTQAYRAQAGVPEDLRLRVRSPITSIEVGEEEDDDGTEIDEEEEEEEEDDDY